MACLSPDMSSLSPRMIAARALSGMFDQPGPAPAANPGAFKRRQGQSWSAASRGLTAENLMLGAPGPPAASRRNYQPYPKVRCLHSRALHRVNTIAPSPQRKHLSF